MKNIKFKLITRVMSALVMVTGVFLLFGQGCGQAFKAASTATSGVNISSTCTTSSKTIIDKNYTVVVGQRTVSIAYGQQLLDSFVACTGLGAPSTRTLAEWTTRNQSLSEYGNLVDVSGAMMMGVTAVGAEICRDLVDKEKPLPLASRAIFTTANLDGAGLTQSEVTNAIDMLALSCWQRQTTDEEKTLITNTMSQLGTNSENGALSLCTAMLSSLAAIEQ